jgi:hypothetical protein
VTCLGKSSDNGAYASSANEQETVDSFQSAKHLSSPRIVGESLKARVLIAAVSAALTPLILSGWRFNWPEHISRLVEGC